MVEVNVAEAAIMFERLIDAARRGEEIVITENNIAVARLIPSVEIRHVGARKPGSARGKILCIAPDFDAPLDDFAEYQRWTPSSIPTPFSGTLTTIRN